MRRTQLQAALVAKQAAEDDLLTGGRFRLGVGLGWNPVEYEALGKNFADRGRRVGEQVELLRRLWTERTGALSRQDEPLTGAGLAPRAGQRPIPVWVGGRRARGPDPMGRAGGRGVP